MGWFAGFGQGKFQSNTQAGAEKLLKVAKNCEKMQKSACFFAKNC